MHLDKSVIKIAVAWHSPSNHLPLTCYPVSVTVSTDAFIHCCTYRWQWKGRC